jgi:hypothetical protein
MTEPHPGEAGKGHQAGWLPGQGSLGQGTPRSGRRGGQGGPNPAGLHPSPDAAFTPSTQGSDDQLSGGDLQAALGIGAGCLASNWMTPDGSRLAMNRVEFCAHRPQPTVPPRGLRW